MNIPFCRTNFGLEEKKARDKVYKSGWVVMGKKTQEFEEEFAKYVGAKYAVMVDSCTNALFLSIKALGLNNKAEIAVPSLTFVSTAESIWNAGCIPHFVDVSLEDFCVDKDYEPKFQMSIPVNLTGNLAKGHGCVVDSAHRIVRDDVKDSGSLWCYSFYATKNMSTIKGGMIALNDFDTAEWLKKARDHGITRGTTERYKEGKWDYNFSFIGWNMKPHDVMAAEGLEQLKKLDSLNDARGRIITLYNERLGIIRTGLHLYPILVSDRPKFIEYMKERGIQCAVHFLPLHTLHAYKDFPRDELPNTEHFGSKLVSLPLYPQMTDKEIDYVCNSVTDSGLIL